MVILIIRIIASLSVGTNNTYDVYNHNMHVSVGTYIIYIPTSKLEIQLYTIQ